MAELHRLKTLLESCFGDADDEQGLATLQQQLSIYPEDMAEFQADLDEVLPDPVVCQSLLENYAHRYLDPQASRDWLHWLKGASTAP